MKHGKGLYTFAANPSDLVRRIQNMNPKLAQELSALELDWYRIVNQTDDDKDTSEVYVYDSIGGWFGVEASTFVQELNDITTSNINVHINSPGGIVHDGIAIHNAIMMHPANITVYVDSLAASMASVIAMAGDKIIMMPGSQMMIHDAAMYTVGNAQELREEADWLDRQSQNIAGFYALKTGGTPDEMRAQMLAETWMFAQEAVDLGFADEVYSKTDKDDKEPENEEVKQVHAKLTFKHPLANRGFNYAGRRRAPEPQPVASAKPKSIDEMTDEEFKQHCLAQMIGSK